MENKIEVYEEFAQPHAKIPGEYFTNLQSAHNAEAGNTYMKAKQGVAAHTSIPRVNKAPKATQIDPPNINKRHSRGKSVDRRT